VSEQQIKIGDTVIIYSRRWELAEAKVLRIANHPRYDALTVEVEYDTIFGRRTKWMDVDAIKGVLPREN
jgi:hypothetical protein